jgi:hypothetical protein
MFSLRQLQRPLSCTVNASMLGVCRFIERRNGISPFDDAAIISFQRTACVDNSTILHTAAFKRSGMIPDTCGSTFFRLPGDGLEAVALLLRAEAGERRKNVARPRNHSGALQPLHPHARFHHLAGRVCGDGYGPRDTARGCGDCSATLTLAVFTGFPAPTTKATTV